MAIKAYRMTLTVRGPVFVGSGKEYTKKEYIMLPRGYVGIVDMRKIYALAYRKKIARQFEDFMLDRTGDKCRKILNLEEWLESVRLKDEAVKTCISYVLGMGDTKLAKGRMQIMAFVKNAYGKPYIPGSSIKGALRTILATAKIKEKVGLRECIGSELKKNLPIGKKRNYYLADTAKMAESKIFRTKKREGTEPDDAVNDMMQGMVLGDSDPIDDTKALVLAQKIERHRDDIDGKERSLNLLREALRPGTRIAFPLTIDEQICPVTAGDILEAIYTFDDEYNRNFLTKFKGMDPLRPDRPQIFLGGGTGFVSKTLVYPVLGQKDGVDAAMEIFRQTRVPEKHKHNKDRGLGVSPHVLKCTYYEGKTVQMGLCDVEIEDMEGT